MMELVLFFSPQASDIFCRALNQKLFSKATTFGMNDFLPIFAIYERQTVLSFFYRIYSKITTILET